MDAMENLKGLDNVRVAREVTADAAERFCEDFEFVEGRVEGADMVSGRGEDEEEEREWEEQGGRERGILLRELFPRTTDEIRVLLS